MGYGGLKASFRKEEQMAVETGDTITLNCKGMLEDGQVVTDSQEDGPLTFKVGEFDVITGLNGAVVGMDEGESKKVTLEPEQAFGEYDENKLVGYPLDQLPEETSVGARFKDDQTENIWTVREVRQDEGLAVLDSNHVLAGQNLVFEISVQKVDKP